MPNSSRKHFSNLSNDNFNQKTIEQKNSLASKLNYKRISKQQQQQQQQQKQQHAHANNSNLIYWEKFRINFLLFYSLCDRPNPNLSLTHFLSHTLYLSNTHAHLHTHSLSNTHTHTHTNTQAHKHTHTHIHSISLTLTTTHAHLHTLSL